MIGHVGHTATVHMTDQYAAVNATVIAAAQEQMKEHGRKHGRKRLQYGALKRLREQPDLLARTGLVVTNETPLPQLICAEVRLRMVVNAEKLLADPAKLQLVTDVKTSLKLPAEGELSFDQMRDLSYWTRTSVSVSTRIRNVTQRIGPGRVLEHQALRPTHTKMQFAMALRRLSTEKPVKMVVQWKGNRQTLTATLFVNVATSFLTTHLSHTCPSTATCPEERRGKVVTLPPGRWLMAYVRWHISPPLRRRTSVLQFLRLDTPARCGPK